jgi:hypothetical protein
MEQSPSWEANIHSASQEIPRLLLNKIFITVFTRAHNFSYPETDASNPQLPTLFPWDPLLYYPPIYA